VSRVEGIRAVQQQANRWTPWLRQERTPPPPFDRSKGIVRELFEVAALASCGTGLQTRKET
jgi:hypothetical protein